MPDRSESPCVAGSFSLLPSGSFTAESMGRWCGWGRLSLPASVPSEGAELQALVGLLALSTGMNSPQLYKTLPLNREISPIQLERSCALFCCNTTRATCFQTSPWLVPVLLLLLLSFSAECCPSPSFADVVPSAAKCLWPSLQTEHSRPSAFGDRISTMA